MRRSVSFVVIVVAVLSLGSLGLASAGEKECADKFEKCEPPTTTVPSSTSTVPETTTYQVATTTTQTGSTTAFAVTTTTTGVTVTTSTAEVTSTTSTTAPTTEMPPAIALTREFHSAG